MSCEMRKNDIGTEIRVCIEDCDGDAVDISAATTKQIIFKKPSGSLLTKDANFLTDGSDGKLSYVSRDGDLDEIGTWKIQASITIGANIWKSTFKSFKVHRNLS